MKLRRQSFRSALLAAAAIGLSAPAGTAADDGDDGTAPFAVVFFPPTPPVYGARIPERAADTRLRFQGRWLTPPDGLGEFAGDTLFPALSTRLYARSLSPALAARVEAYRARRNFLLHALLDRCLTLHDVEPDQRERALRVFATLQTPEIVTLETEADALRRELTRGRLGLDAGWNASRAWRIGSFPANRPWMNIEAEFQVVRAAAFYEEGFTPAQRGLLRELAEDMDRTARKARGEAVDRSEAEAIYFSPETTRFRLPPNLAKETLERLGAYNAQKAELKHELRAAVFGHENSTRSERAAAFARLADEQWPRLGSLEQLAEQLRTDLAPRFVPAPPEKPPTIPAWLIDVIHTYNEDRDSYFGDLRQRVREAMADVPRPSRGQDSDLRMQLEDEYAKRRKEIEADVLRQFQADTAARFAALQQRHEGIRTALEAIAKTTRDPKTGRPLNVEALLREHAAAMNEYDGFGRASAIYATYRTAMLQRGLSPEQRRLLFSYAVAGLAQPLPYGEPMPRRNLKFPLPR